MQLNLGWKGEIHERSLENIEEMSLSSARGRSVTAGAAHGSCSRDAWGSLQCEGNGEVTVPRGCFGLKGEKKE